MHPRSGPESPAGGAPALPASLGIPPAIERHPLAIGGHRVRQGQQLHLHTMCSTAQALGAWARVLYDDGEDDILYVNESVPSASVVEEDWYSQQVVKKSGWVVAAAVTTLEEKRGRQLVSLGMDPLGTVLLRGYAVQHVPLALGQYREGGPEGGDGDYELVTVSDDVVPVTVTYSLAGVQQLRKIIGFIWYFIADANAASRVLSVRLRDSYGALPTGYAQGSNSSIWKPASLTLTASQQGCIWGDAKSSGANDNGTLTVDSVETPFPLTVQEGDPVDIQFIITGELAGDRNSIYFLAENWLVR